MAKASLTLVAGRSNCRRRLGHCKELENVLFLLQWTATVAGCSRFAASLKEPYPVIWCYNSKQDQLQWWQIWCPILSQFILEFCGFALSCYNPDLEAHLRLIQTCIIRCVKCRKIENSLCEHFLHVHLIGQPYCILRSLCEWAFTLEKSHKMSAFLSVEFKDTSSPNWYSHRQSTIFWL